MLKKLPIIRSCAGYRDILSAMSHIGRESAINIFGEALISYFGSRHIFLTNSGISSFYIILEVLKELSEKKEIILPAYTAGSLVVAARKAGLKPILCDISLEDLNLDEDFLFSALSDNTLAVVGVHMFGINMKGIASLKAKMPRGVFLIEDCAQSMGSRTSDRESGSFGDVSFFSFNRGKNLPLYGGGCIVTSNDEIAEGIENKVNTLAKRGVFCELADLIKILAFNLTGNPIIYGLGFSLVSRFKETAPPKNIVVNKIGGLQAALGCELAERMESFFSARYHNGMALIAALKGSRHVMLPQIPEGTRYAFNRLPVIFKDIKFRALAAEKLWVSGVETSRMYLKPLHHMFDMGYAPTDFPNAVYLAERLLTLPAHPYVTGVDIRNIADAIG